MNKHIISIVIPAYNLPNYTVKTLQSIAEQTYRPLRVILLDDCSPISLEPLADAYKVVFNTVGIEFSYVRNEINLGVDNGLKMHSLLGDGWGLVVHHDDWLTDPTFLSSCMEILENNPDSNIQLFYANTMTEKSRIRMVDSYDENWSIIRGSDFVPYILNKGFTAWAAVLFNNAILKNIGWPNELFYTDSRTAQRLDLDTDDGFSGFYLLAMHGNVCVTGKLVGVRGEPKSSYSKSSSWHKIGNSMFYIYYNLYKYKSSALYAKKVKQQALASVYYWGFAKEEGVNRKLLRHFDSMHMKVHYFAAYATSRLGVNHAIACAYVLLTINAWSRVIKIFMNVLLKISKKVLTKCLKMVLRVANRRLLIWCFRILNYGSRKLKSEIQNQINLKGNLRPKVQNFSGKLNLGCGVHFLDGFLNVDMSDISVYDNKIFGALGWYDLTKGLDLSDNSVNFITTSHMLEHFNIFDGFYFMQECYRVLRPWCQLRIVVPNIPLSLKAYVENTIVPLFNSHSASGEIFAAIPHVSSIEAVDCLNFAVYDTGGEWGHKAIYDLSTLKRLLSEIGFSTVLESEYDPATDLVGHKEFSIYIMAEK